MERVSQVAGVALPGAEADAEAVAVAGTEAGLWQVRWTISLMSVAEGRLAESAAAVAARKTGLDAALAATTETDRLAVRHRKRG